MVKGSLGGWEIFLQGEDGYLGVTFFFLRKGLLGVTFILLSLIRFLGSCFEYFVIFSWYKTDDKKGHVLTIYSINYFGIVTSVEENY